ncbi:MAG: hypothetical protein KatS3mg051_1901 [Anaerolineae bacterium]|nr:MAG: hypothetical protein KatS3mg051_1901 [Anaerolineae bacterium]
MPAGTASTSTRCPREAPTSKRCSACGRWCRGTSAPSIVYECLVCGAKLDRERQCRAHFDADFGAVGLDRGRVMSLSAYALRTTGSLPGTSSARSDRTPALVRSARARIAALRITCGAASGCALRAREDSGQTSWRAVGHGSLQVGAAPAGRPIFFSCLQPSPQQRPLHRLFIFLELTHVNLMPTLCLTTADDIGDTMKEMQDRLTFRIRPDQIRALQEEARKERRTLSQLIRLILDRELMRRGHRLQDDTPA